MLRTNRRDVVHIPNICSLVSDSKEDHCRGVTSGPANLFLLAAMARSSSVQDVFMLFGDSITQGAWDVGFNGVGQRLSRESFFIFITLGSQVFVDVYARKLDVLNRGLSGYTTEWSLPILKLVRSSYKYLCMKITGIQLINQIPTSSKIRILTIWFGANDACVPPSPQHVPLPKFISNLKSMISFVKSCDSQPSGTHILLISPPPVNTIDRAADLASRDPPLQLDREFEVTKRYAQAVEQVAREEGVAFVDVWNKIWDAADREEVNLRRFLRDGLHLNAEGYAVRALLAFFSNFDWTVVVDRI